MSYLQVVGEQHQLVERHMAAFTARLAELQERHGLQLGSLEVSSSCRACRRNPCVPCCGNSSSRCCKLCITQLVGDLLQSLPEKSMHATFTADLLPAGCGCSTIFPSLQGT
jgi:hypothetical protein